MLSINISHIISTRKRGGYNPSSQLNLKQYRGKEIVTGEVQGSTKSKYRNILNNWFLTNEESIKQDKKRELKTTSPDKTNCKQQGIVEIGGWSSSRATLHQSEVDKSSSPTSTIPRRWVQWRKNQIQNLFTNIKTIIE